MTDDTLSRSSGRNVLRLERRLRHPQEKVWRAITDPEHLVHWFPSAVRMEPTAGATMTFDFGEGVTMSGEITDLDPPRLFAFTWDVDHLRWELHADGEGTLLVLVHTFDDRYGGASFASGWNACVALLDELLTTGETHTSGRFEQVHEDYVVKLGLDHGEAEDTPDGWRMRYERQLVRPADAAWRLLSGSTEAAPGGPVPEGFAVPDFPPGPVTEAKSGALLEYGWERGTVRVELGEGTGHGARLIVTQTGPPGDEDAKATALEAWRTKIESFARGLPAS
ncbi:MAG: toxin-antitoxin system toxin subunit [Streptosporangiales bacterium]|nr:toxin-antitoxin system toxin subunit [Streptosporangiales bacterium]